MANFYIQQKELIIMSKEQKYSIVSVRLTTEDKENLEKMAKEEDRSMSSIIRKAIEEYINK